MPISPIAIGIGVFFLILSLGLFLYARHLGKRLAKIVDTPTSTAQQLTQFQSRSGNLPGRNDRIVEVKGTLRCDKPVQGEFSNLNCAYCRSIQKEKVRHTYYSGGKRRTSTKWNTISDRENMSDFWVEDASGKVLVQPRGADVDGRVSVDRFKHAEGLSLGGRVLDCLLGGTSDRVLGVQYTETILPLNTRVYVLGELATTSRGPVIFAPKVGGDFLISLKSEEELVKRQTLLVLGLYIGSVISIIVGVAMAINMR